MIAGLLLASGASRRFGSNKLLALLGGRPVVRWSAESLASAVERTLVVVPREHAALRSALEGLAVEWIVNPVAESGMATSIRAGVDAMPGAAEAVVIALADQPTIDPAVIRRVVACWRERRATASAVTTAYADGRGHPTLFAAELFPMLRALEGDRGARALLDALGDRVAVVHVAGERPADVDTPADLAVLGERIARG